MADKAAATNGTKTNGTVTPPANMARVGSVANAPWWNIKNGNVLYGELENMYDRPDERAKSGRSKFFQLKLLQDAEARFGRGKDAKVGPVKAGTVVNLNYGPKTKELEKFVDAILRGAKYTVWVHVDGDKFDIGKGQTMWPLDVRAQQTQAPLVSDDPDFDGSEDDNEGSDAPAGAATA
jgi:hypothetical protein